MPSRRTMAVVAPFAFVLLSLLPQHGSWNIVVRQDGGSFSLLLQGEPESRTTATLREVFGFVFGWAA